MSLAGERFYAVDENPAGFNLSSTTLGGTSVRMSLIVADPDGFAARAVAAGAKIVFPIADQPYGMRQGRIADPEGHHWLIGKPLR
jgi:PhnB protein